MKIIALVLIVLFIISPFAHKLLEKSLSQKQMIVLRTVAIMIMMGAIVFSFFTIFT